MDSHLSVQTEVVDQGGAVTARLCAATKCSYVSITYTYLLLSALPSAVKAIY